MTLRALQTATATTTTTTTATTVNYNKNSKDDSILLTVNSQTAEYPWPLTIPFSCSLAIYIFSL